MLPVAVHDAALAGTVVGLGPTDGPTGSLLLPVALTAGARLGPPTEGWPGWVSQLATPTATRLITTAAAMRVRMFLLGSLPGNALRLYRIADAPRRQS